MDRYARLFTRRADGRYQASYTKDGKRYYLYDRSPERLFKRLTEARNGRAVTVADYASKWEAVHRDEVGVRTWNNYAPHLRRLVDRWGSVPVDEIRVADIASDLTAAKSRRYSATIVNTIRSIWSGILDQAVIDGTIRHNPAREVRLPKGLPRSKRNAPCDDDIQIILGNTHKQFGLFPLVLLCTGMRKSEALALTWDDIDLDRGIIHVTKSIEYPDGNTPSLKAPKTAAGVRDVPIPDILREHLHPSEGIVFKQKEYNGHPGGGYMSCRAYETAWKRYCDETGLRCTAHQLRHATATILYEAGADELQAQRILGHANPQTTRDIYTDLRQRHLEDGYHKLNEALNKMSG